MPLNVVVDGAEKAVNDAYVVIGGVQKRVTKITTIIGGAEKLVQQFADPLSMSITPLTISGGGSFSGPLVVTTDAATANVTGGLGPYTYVWTVTSGTGITVNSPSMASTTARKTVISGDSDTGTLQCEVTDAIGQTATDTIEAFFTNFDFS